MNDKTSLDLKMLQGTWSQILFEENGIVDPPDSHSAPSAIMTVLDNRFHVAVPGQETILEGTFILDATTLPKFITWTDATGADAGKSFPAIYELSEDRFIFVAADEDMATPTEFRAGPGLTLRSFTRYGDI